jgi:hypothetical protein
MKKIKKDLLMKDIPGREAHIKMEMSGRAHIEFV